MKIKRVAVHNFRGVLDATFDLFGYSLVVGANNGGKSTLIDAIRCFYEKDGVKFDSSKDFPKNVPEDGESWVDIDYTLSPAENESLRDEYKSDERILRLRKYLKSADKKKNGVIFFKSALGEVFNEAFYGAKNVQGGKIGELIYIPAISKVDDQTKLSGPSALRELLNHVVSSVVGESDSYKKFCEDVDWFSSDALKTTSEEGHSLNAVRERINDFLTPWNTEFSLRFNPPSASDLVKNMIGWGLWDNALKFDLDVSRCGSGFQRHFIYSLIRIGANFLPSKSSAKSKDFTPSLTLILFEEPEAFLHPEKQEELARDLRLLGSQGDWQVLCTTHSPHFVSRCMNELQAIIRVSRSEGIVSVHQVSEKRLKEIFEENMAQPESKKAILDLEAEGIRYAMWLDSRRASAFFSNNVLLAEGPTETAFITRLQDDGKIPGNIFVLDCFGKFNVHRFMAILDSLGISHAVLIDSDQGKNDHAEWNEFILSRRCSLTKDVVFLDKDLETFLGVDKPANERQKPLALLMKYAKGGIAEVKVQKFCRLVVEALFGKYS